IKIVIDTNLLIAGRWNRRSSSKRILDICLEGAVQGVYTPQIKDENLYILGKVKAPKEYLDKVIRFYNLSKRAKYEEKRVTASRDFSDNRFLEAALAGKADYIISSDRHLLELEEFRGIRIVKPSEFIKIIGDMVPG
ncbi:MAG: putative toxin-antitoxin system toxin component, PIN family, partial [Candidatus Micrarchaeota archaeon]